MASERCEYCLSDFIVNHSEGSSCASCCRVQSIPSYLSPGGLMEELVSLGMETLPELQALEDRHLITKEIALSSHKLFQKFRKLKINFATSSLLIFVIHQSMAKHLGATYTILQLSSLLAPDISANDLMKRYTKLWQKFPKLLTFSPHFPRQYIPLHILISCPKTRRAIFRKSISLQIKSGYIIQLSTCVYVAIKNMLKICLDQELLVFICNFPHWKHISHIQTFWQNPSQ